MPAYLWMMNAIWEEYRVKIDWDDEKIFDFCQATLCTNN